MVLLSYRTCDTRDTKLVQVQISHSSGKMRFILLVVNSASELLKKKDKERNVFLNNLV